MRNLSFAFYISVISIFLGANEVLAQTCFAPVRPFVPSDPADAQRFADLIRQDFETYLADVQAYFRCLEVERIRAIEEAREVTDEYGRFIEGVERRR